MHWSRETPDPSCFAGLSLVRLAAMDQHENSGLLLLLLEVVFIQTPTLSGRLSLPLVELVSSNSLVLVGRDLDILTAWVRSFRRTEHATWFTRASWLPSAKDSFVRDLRLRVVCSPNFAIWAGYSSLRISAAYLSIATMRARNLETATYWSIQRVVSTSSNKAAAWTSLRMHGTQCWLQRSMKSRIMYA